MHVPTGPGNRHPHGTVGVALAWCLTIGAMAVLVYLLWV